MEHFFRLCIGEKRWTWEKNLKKNKKWSRLIRDLKVGQSAHFLLASSPSNQILLHFALDGPVCYFLLSFYHSIVAKPHMWWHCKQYIRKYFVIFATFSNGNRLIYTLFSLFFALIKGWLHWYLHFLAGQLTLFQPGRADYPHLLLLAPPMFFTFQHSWI